MPLKLTPTRIKSTLYLRIPKDIKDLHSIARDTPFTFEFSDGEDGLKLVYRLQAAVEKRK